MSDAADKLTPADPNDLAASLPFALRRQGRKRVHNADEIIAEIVAKRLVDHLGRAGFVIMKRRFALCTSKFCEATSEAPHNAGYGRERRVVSMVA